MNITCRYLLPGGNGIRKEVLSITSRNIEVIDWSKKHSDQCSNEDNENDLSLDSHIVQHFLRSMNWQADCIGLSRTWRNMHAMSTQEQDNIVSILGPENKSDINVSVL